MPVRKFRDVSEMERTTWLEPGDPRLVRAIRYCWDLAERLSPVSLPPGVHKFRSVEEMNAATERWERDDRRRRAARGER